MHKIAPILLLIMASSVVFFTVNGNHGLKELLRVSSQVKLAHKENQKLQSNILDIETKIALLKNDKYYLEKIAREDLGLAKPGDIVYIFPKKSELTRK